jgi:hypothetical protein
MHERLRGMLVTFKTRRAKKSYQCSDYKMSKFESINNLKMVNVHF